MRCLLFLSALLIFTGAQAQSPSSLSSVTIELDAGQSLPLASKIRYELVSSNAKKVAQELQGWKSIGVSQVDDKSLLITMTEQPHSSCDLRDQYSKTSFVIDLEEESTKRFVAGFTKGSNQPWALEELTEYVHSYIKNTTYVHGFNIASVVAAQRAGDCTEYAVLATALARSSNLPSRVVIGTVIIEGKDQVAAFGHAWAEVWHKGQWKIVDAALYGSTAVKHFYLPAAELEKEGPGFTMSLLKAVTLMPTKIKRLRDF
ncbi:MAG: hypothetical protein COA42_15225 [Alteromonadaceae bacterium]|nr:MAG: hypothetical protein COA42_15225 [Alteromonadaceae bacterium]